MTRDARALAAAAVAALVLLVLLAASITTPGERARRLAEDGATLLQAIADATVDVRRDARADVDAGIDDVDAGVAPSTERHGSTSTSTSPSTSTSTSPAAHPSSPRPPRSPPSSSAASLTLENTCSVTIEVFWLDEDGVERWRGFVGRGSVVTFETFEGHTFRVRPRGDRATELALVTAYGNTHAEICPASSPLYDRAPPPPLAPDRLPRTCTVDTGPPTHVTFVSACDAPLDLYWIDRACERRPYASIPPGGSHEQATFVHHVWRAETPDGRVVEERAATRDDALWLLACPSAPR